MYLFITAKLYSVNNLYSIGPLNSSMYCRTSSVAICMGVFIRVHACCPLNCFLPSHYTANGCLHFFMCFFKAVVQEMNRLGMIVDISHTSWDTAQVVLKHSKAPVIFSHSSSYSICNHSRNVPDWLLHELVRQFTECLIACLVCLIKLLFYQSGFNLSL